MILLAGIAAAATVAVLDFDGYGVAFSDAQVVTQGVRDAFLEGGALDPLSGSDIADGVSKGQDEALGRARALAAEARRRSAAGDASGAVGPLAEALALHAAALSDVGRRPELADATFLYGACLLELGRAGDARARFAEAAALVPDYARERGTRMSKGSAALLATAEEGVAKGPRRTRPATEISRIADALSVDYVVTGWVTGDGALAARLYRGDALLAEAKGGLEDRPGRAIDPGYGALVRRLVEAGLGGPAPADADAPDADAPDADAPDADAGASEEPDLPDLDADDRAARPERSGAGKVTITTTGAIRTPTPVVERWWFWTAVVGAAGGGAFGLWYALTPAPTVYEEEPDGWTVTVPVE